MLDIETMGLDPVVDDVIEIGILEVNEVNGYYQPGRTYNRVLFTSQKPKDTWIANTHKELLEISRRTPMVDTSTVRKEILAFFKECGVSKTPELMGLNLMSLDVPFLIAKGILKERGDYHYRICELRGSYVFAASALKLNLDTLFKKAQDAYPEIQYDNKAHRALPDCYNQLKTLNGMLRLVRSKAV